MYTKLASGATAALLAITIATAPVPAAPTILVRNTTTTQPADQVIEGCHWANTADQWEYPDQTPCRGTGEDPTTDAGR